ncbi:MAG: amidase, partial [Anaerolineaceae bacterium]|nr:amidase [Anaerolineaceae bacterium]
VYWPWFRHATDEVVKANEAMLDKLVKAGAQIVEIEIADMDLTRVAHAITILAEMAECMNSFPAHRKDFADSTRLSLVLGRAMTSADYLQAQRMRTRAMNIYKEVLSKVDVIVTPATGMPAPVVPPQALSNGWSDLGVDTEEMRYMIPGNLTGLPAIVFPVGYSDAGMPIGMQVMGRAWEEALLLRVAHVAEQFVERKLPVNFYPIL